MIRLQCPACQCIVKISPDTIAQHPVVRCARCQSLVPVAQCIVQEKSATRRRPPKRRGTRQSQAVLTIGIVLGTLLVVCTGFGVYWLGFRTPSSLENSRNSRGSSSTAPFVMAEVEKNTYVPEEYRRRGKYLKQAIVKMKEVVEVLEKVDSPAELTAFLTNLETYQKDMQRLLVESNCQSFAFDNSYIPDFDSLQNESRFLAERAFRQGERIVQDDDMRQILTVSAARIKNSCLNQNLFEHLRVMLPVPETFYQFKFDTSPFRAKKSNDEDKNFRAMTGGELIAWLKTAPSYRKYEVLKQLSGETVTPSRQETVLTITNMFMEDSDINDKEEVFKIFRRWVTTQEDKERFGKHAEELLKYPVTRESAMRWFGENKVISSSKEVARFLKENYSEKSEAAEALIAMGSAAEPVVLPYLEAIEAKTRHLAIKVLARIGTRQCLPALRKMNNDPQVSLAARQAIVIIDKRHPGR